MKKNVWRRSRQRSMLWRRKTINHVYLVGCGASFAVFKPVEFI